MEGLISTGTNPSSLFYFEEKRIIIISFLFFIFLWTICHRKSQTNKRLSWVVTDHRRLSQVVTHQQRLSQYITEHQRLSQDVTDYQDTIDQQRQSKEIIYHV